MVAKFGAEQPSMPQPGLAASAHLLEGGADGLLHRVVDLDVLGPAAEVAVEGEKARVLARAVVVELAGGEAGRAQTVALGGVVGDLGAAAEVGLGQPQVGEPGGDAGDVHLGAVVGGAGEGEALGREAVGGAALDEGQGLEHLAGRAREDHRVGVAPGGDDAAGGVADHRVAAVDRFAQAAAPGLDHRHRFSHR